MPTPSGRFLGRLRDFTDTRDHMYGLERIVTPLADMGPYVDLRVDLPPCFDQGQLNACGPNAADGLLSYYYEENGDGFSRLQIYYATRQLEDTQRNDDGVRLRDLMKALQNPGAVSENIWPYDPAQVLQCPPSFPVSDRRYTIKNYQRLTSTSEMIHCLWEGNPFIIGFDVYESFDSDQLARTGVMVYPTPDEKLLGGHAVLAVGYDLNFKYNRDLQHSGIDFAQVGNAALLLRNSWGTAWGQDGHFWMPLDYPADSADCWTAIMENPS
ncbi:MAG TPA: C1 family peptidase [Candidatus Acidoferrum sp.]